MIRGWVAVSLLLLWIGGCATDMDMPVQVDLQNRMSAKTVGRQRVAALPPQVVLSLLDSANHTTEITDPGGDLEGEARAHLESVMAENGDHLVTREELAACRMPCAELFRWGTRATFEIGLQRARIREFGRRSTGEWQFPGDIAAVHQALNADLVLFVVLKQTRETEGRRKNEVVGTVLGDGYITVGKQVDVACVADLRDGRMSWCTADRDDTTDLANPGQIAVVMRRLMARAFVLPARH